MKRVWSLLAFVLLACGSAGSGVKAQPQGQEDPASIAAAGASAAPNLEQVQGRVDALAEQAAVMQSDLGKLKKIKVSGYLQARYEVNETSKSIVTVAGSPPAIKAPNTNRFFIRRGRLKVTYDSSPLSQAVIYLDGGQDRAIRLLEGYVTLRDPWTPDHRHAINIGQMNVPFGYEIGRSSSVRELPERSRAENVLFAGERDRGITLTSQWLPQLSTVVGLLNGGGINHPDFPNSDPTMGKDLVGRVRWSQGIFDAAASLYQGRNVVPLTGKSFTHDKTRYGFDAQWFYGVPVIGGGSVRGELYSGHEANPDSAKALTKDRGLIAGKEAAHLATDFVGWYAMWVQNLGEQLQVAARYDVYDPNTGMDHDHYRRAGLGVNYFYDGNTRITVAYDMPRTDVRRPSPGTGYGDPGDNFWTVQFQHTF